MSALCFEDCGDLGLPIAFRDLPTSSGVVRPLIPLAAQPDTSPADTPSTRPDQAEVGGAPFSTAGG